MLISRTERGANLVLIQFVPLTLFPFFLSYSLDFFNHATSLKKSTDTARAVKREQLIGLITIVLHERLLDFSLPVLSAHACYLLFYVINRNRY